VTSSVHQAREALGYRLRDLRRDARLTGQQLAGLAGWHSSKVSKIEHGKQTPSEDDIRVWCEHTRAPDQVAELIAAVRHIEAMWMEWRQVLGVGTRRRQAASQRLESRARLLRWYEPVLVPGLLHTAEYAAAVMRRVIDFYQVPDDLDAGVATRMQRQHVLYQRGRRFRFVLAQQALATTVGDARVMIGQLDRLLAVMSLPGVSIGVVPAAAEYVMPTNQFTIYDERLVHVESISAELTINQPREIALYVRAFDELARQAVFGSDAAGLIGAALSQFQIDRLDDHGRACAPEHHDHDAR
jgi:transcriptional regulator with XRE-family HTH domain